MQLKTGILDKVLEFLSNNHMTGLAIIRASDSPGQHSAVQVLCCFFKYPVFINVMLPAPVYFDSL